MHEPFETRFYLSPALTANQRAAAEARIRAAGAQLDARIRRGTHFVVATRAECRAARRDIAAGHRMPTYITVVELSRRLAGSMVVALVDGEEHVLDFGSGKLTKRFPSAVAAMLPLAEDEVTKERVEEILAAAGIKTTRDEDDDIVAHALGEPVNVMISEERQFVRFVKLVRVGAFVSEESRSEAVTKLNHEFDVVRFRLWHDTGICADYSMPFTYGILPAQLVSMLLGVSWVVQSALRSDIASELLGETG